MWLKTERYIISKLEWDLGINKALIDILWKEQRILEELVNIYPHVIVPPVCFPNMYEIHKQEPLNTIICLTNYFLMDAANIYWALR